MHGLGDVVDPGELGIARRLQRGAGTRAAHIAFAAGGIDKIQQAAADAAHASGSAIRPGPTACSNR